MKITITCILILFLNINNLSCLEINKKKSIIEILEEIMLIEIEHSQLYNQDISDINSLQHYSNMREGLNVTYRLSVDKRKMFNQKKMDVYCGYSSSKRIGNLYMYGYNWYFVVAVIDSNVYLLKGFEVDHLKKFFSTVFHMMSEKEDLLDLAKLVLLLEGKNEINYNFPTMESPELKILINKTGFEIFIEIEKIKLKEKFKYHIIFDKEWNYSLKLLE